MSYYINVPQQRTARLTRESLKFDIQGLYTDGFSTCQLVVIIGSNGISLTHADMHFEKTDIDKEIAWAGEGCEKILIYRSAEVKQLKAELTEQELEEYNDFFIHNIWSKAETGVDDKWVRKPVENSTEAILVQFKETSSTIHKNIAPLSIAQKPKNLLRHPSEMQFFIACKIEECICFTSDVHLVKTHLIFNGIYWINLPEKECRPYDSDPILLMKRLSIIKNDKQLVSIARNLSNVRLDLRNQGKTVKLVDRDIVDNSVRQAKHFQFYPCDKPALDFLVIDLIHALKDHILMFANEISENRTFISSLEKLLGQKQLEFEQIDEFFTPYMNETHKTEFRKHFMQNYKFLKEIYNERMEYVTVQSIYNQNKKEIKEIMNLVAQLFSAKKFDIACPLLEKAYRLSWCYQDTEPSLMSLYSNLGQCYYQLKEYAKAIPHLENSILLRKKHKKSLEHLQIYEGILNSCKAQLKESTPQEPVTRDDKVVPKKLRI